MFSKFHYFFEFKDSFECGTLKELDFEQKENFKIIIKELQNFNF